MYSNFRDKNFTTPNINLLNFAGEICTSCKIQISENHWSKLY